jgi:hypothetical protein
MDVTGQFHALTSLIPEKTWRYSWDTRLGGPQSRSESYVEEKFSNPSSPAVQPVACQYTDWAVIFIILCTHLQMRLFLYLYFTALLHLFRKLTSMKFRDS